MSRDVQSEIATLLKQNPVVLFMKGTRAMPQCGFSATVVQCLQDADAAFFEIDVLSDPEIRQGIKDYSDWPTIPQLYIGGEFVGGCDIIREMHAKGELTAAVQQQQGRAQAAAT